MPLAKKLPGLTRYEVSTGTVTAPASSKGVYLVATLHFASMDELNRALGSPEGKATARDLANFATGGVDLLDVRRPGHLTAGRINRDDEGNNEAGALPLRLLSIERLDLFVAQYQRRSRGCHQPVRPPSERQIQ